MRLRFHNLIILIVMLENIVLDQNQFNGRVMENLKDLKCNINEMDAIDVNSVN